MKNKIQSNLSIADMLHRGHLVITDTFDDEQLEVWGECEVMT